MKYVIGRCRASGQFLPIVFGDELVHSDAARMLPPTAEVMGAGSVTLKKGRTLISGESTSLALGPSELDSPILTLFLGAGLSGLQLQNAITVAVIGKN